MFSWFYPSLLCFSADFQEPYAVVVLLEKDLVVIDLAQNGYVSPTAFVICVIFVTNVFDAITLLHYSVNLMVLTCDVFCSYPIFENPYPMMIHESPVTSCEYLADCPVDLIPALYSVGSRQKRQGYSKKVQQCVHTFKYANLIDNDVFKVKTSCLHTHTLAFEWLDCGPWWIAPLPYACVTSGPRRAAHCVLRLCGSETQTGVFMVWKKAWTLSQDWSAVCKLWLCLPQGAG